MSLSRREASPGVFPSPQSPVPSPQSPVPSPQSPVPSPQSPVPSPQSPVPSPQSWYRFAGVRHTIPVPPTLLRPLWIAVVATVLFMVVAMIQGIAREGYDSWHQAVSALSLGPGGWIQAINFVASGAAVANTAPVWRQLLAGGRGAVAYPALTAVVGLSVIAAGFIPQDPAAGYDPAGVDRQRPTTLGLVHLGIAGVAAACSVAGLFVMAARFGGDRNWLGWATYSRAMAVLVIACVGIYGVWSTRATGFGGTFERLAIVIPIVWTATLLRRLGSGASFMVARAPDRQHWGQSRGSESLL